MDKDKLQLRRQIDQLFSMIEETQKLAQTTARAQDTRHTAIMPGETVQILDADGNVAAYFGGSNESGQLIEHVNGPEPKQPSTPELDSPGPSALSVVADGLDAEGESAQGNHARVLIHASHTEFIPDESTVVGSFIGPEGRQDVILEPGVWYVAIQWQTQSGQLSEPSEVVEIEIEQLVNSADIQAALDEAQSALDEAKADFEKGNKERKAELENLNNVVLPGLEEALREKADSSELGTLDQTLREAFGEADETIRAAADEAKQAAISAGATAEEAEAAAAKAVADAEAAYERAEAAESSAATAESSADAAAKDAADALEQAQAAGGDFAAAQAAAEAAQAAADAARGHADAAGTAAAEADAKAAQAAADAAKAQAEAVAAAASSGTSASEAQAAKDRADAAAKDAQDAYTRAQEAEDAASASAGSANAAEAAADTAAANAADALSRAQAAEGDAGAAQKAADDAQRYADEAERKAEKAGTDAANADAKAARAAADAAKAVADAAKAAQDAAAAKVEAEAAKEYADQQDNKIAAAAATDAQEKADEAIRQAQEALDNLEVGSRNYFLGSHPGPPFSYSSNNSRTGLIRSGYEDGVFWISGHLVESPESFYISTYANWTFERGVGISYSEDILPLPSVVTQSMEIMCHEPIDVRLGSQDEYTTLAPGVWTRLETTYEPASRPSALTSIDSQEFPGDTRVYLRNWKLEKGHKATDWTPAPEDIQSAIDAAKQDAADAHEAAGEAHAHADAAMTRAAEAESTAIAEAKRLAKDAKDRAEEAIAKGKVIDTRNDNQPPSWYWSNYAKDSVTEFKRRNTMEIDGSGSYVYVTTVVPWNDPSGGPIIQTATMGDVVMTRQSSGRGDDAVWLEWVDPVAEAKDLAENLPKVLHGTGAPSGTAPDGSIWWQHSGSLRGAVTAQWNRVNGQWVSTPISSEAIANLDVGKLTAGGAVISDAVIQDLTAKNGAFDRLDAREGWIGEVALEDGAVGARAINAQEVFTDEATANIVWAEIVRAGLLTAEEALIGDALIKNGAITVDKLHGLEEILTALLRAKKIEAGDIAANSVWADKAWLAAVETASVRLRSSIESWETLISGRGLEVISPEGQPTTQLGNFEENGLTLYRDGEATASVSDDGHISGTIVSANDEFHYQGTELSELIDTSHLPRGAIAYGERDMSGRSYSNFTHLGFLEVSYDAQANRSYLLVIEPYRVVDAQFQRIVIHFDGTDPMIHTGSSTATRQVFTTRIPDQVGGGIFRIRPVETDSLVRVFIGVYSGTAGFRFPNATGNVSMTILDQGMAPENTGVNRADSITGGTHSPDPKPPVTKTRRTRTWNMSWWDTWWQDGTNSPTGIGVKEAVQGRTPYFTAAGTYRSQIGFPSMTSDLSGADIEKIEVRVRVIHSHSGSGGRVRLGTHGNTSRPSSHRNVTGSELTNTHFGRGQEKWVTLPSSTHAGFKNGTNRGVTMFTSSTSSTYYVQANPSRFAIRVTYRK